VTGIAGLHASEIAKVQSGAAGLHPPRHREPTWIVPRRSRSVCTLTRTYGSGSVV